MVVSTRPYPHRLLSSTLASLGLAVVECSQAECLETLSERQPMLVFLVIDPARPGDRELIRNVDEASSSWLIVVQPDNAAAATALDAGADAAVCESEPDILSAQIRAFVRRTRLNSIPPARERFQVGNVLIELDRVLATVNGNPVGLSRTQFRLLSYLAQNAGRVIPPDELRDQANIRSSTPQRPTDTIKTHITRIRKHFRDAGANIEIESRRGFGYFLTEFDSASQPNGNGDDRRSTVDTA